MNAPLIVDAVFCSIAFAAALLLEFHPIEPKYIYPGVLSWDFPRKQGQLPAGSLFVTLTILQLMFIFVINGSGRSVSIRVGVLCLFALSFSSLLCRAVHITLGTPRPDSAVVCGSVNVSYSRCAEVLSKSDLIRQYQSFPAVEAALVMCCAMATCRVMGMFGMMVPYLNILKCIGIAWTVIYSAFLISSGQYRIEDVVGGQVIGAVAALAVLSEGIVEPEKIPSSHEFSLTK